ncbi:hypothetical protein ACRTDM_21600 [Shewanella algae]|uniref:hypothetical protein n=1 Tax=Shewanella algae TaxID=38313 RepID=UPI000D117480|nr:hypothetical protein [Shewanella algae]PSS64118.1 hypothetical protein AYI85_21010 [Shewanella algae]
MTSDSIITITGTLITIVSMFVAIWQASQAKDYKEQIKFDIRKINLSGSSERLKRAQDDIRRLPTSSQNIPRGTKVSDLIHNIKTQFDFSLSVLASDGEDKDIREILSEAQNKLNSYEVSWNAGSPSHQDVNDLQSLVQDAISQANSRIYVLEGKA